MIPRLRPHAKAIIDVLRNAGLLVGDHDAPTTGSPGSELVVVPCVVVYMTTTATLQGSISGRADDALVRFRATSVALTPGGVATLEGEVADVLDGLSLIVPGRAVYRCARVGMPPIERDEEIKPPAFYAPALYKLMSIDATEEP